MILFEASKVHMRLRGRIGWTILLEASRSRDKRRVYHLILFIFRWVFEYSGKIPVWRSGEGMAHAVDVGRILGCMWRSL